MTELVRAEEQLCGTLASMPSKARALLLEGLTLPEPDRARRIGEIHADQRSRSFAELPIDLEEDPAAQASSSANSGSSTGRV